MNNIFLDILASYLFYLEKFTTSNNLIEKSYCFPIINKN